MDESLQELENELKRLQPRRSSDELHARLARELGDAGAATARPKYTAATTLTSWKWFSWQMAAAAAVALVVSLGVWRAQRTVTTQPAAPENVAQAEPIVPKAVQPETQVASTTPASDSYRPVGAANVLYDVKDDGAVTLQDNAPARRMRYRYVDTYTWKNPATNASLKWSVPRDEVRVIPASLH